MNLTARDSIAACNHVDAMLNDNSSHSSDTESNDTIQGKTKWHKQIEHGLIMYLQPFNFSG